MKKQIQFRTRKLALGLVSLCDRLPRSVPNQIISRQLIRASCSVGANYRAVCRAKSYADFINKLSVVEEEADESIFWLELLLDLERGFKEPVSAFTSDMDEIVSIVVAAKKTAKHNLTNQKS
ncbi:MAG: four helix bundle protein [Bacteroidales bacterium]|nr:four helix bundle protein [Bacteroidales bacterium]